MQVYKHAYRTNMTGILKVDTGTTELWTFAIFLDYPHYEQGHIEKCHYPVYLPYKLETMCIPSYFISRLESIKVLKDTLRFSQGRDIAECIKTKLNKKLEKLLEEEANYRYVKQSARRIYKSWYHALSNPYTIFGKKRLLREFDSLQSI